MRHPCNNGWPQGGTHGHQRSAQNDRIHAQNGVVSGGLEPTLFSATAVPGRLGVTVCLSLCGGAFCAGEMR
jgi:hypothetical protein